MGDRVPTSFFTAQDRQRYRHKVRRCLDVLERMLAEGRYETGRKTMGIELELVLADQDENLANVNSEVLSRLASTDFQTELGQFNLEVNIAPHNMAGSVFTELEEELDTSIGFADRKAREVGAHVAVIGIMPTFGDRDVALSAFSNNPRFIALNEQIILARGENLAVAIDGVEHLACETNSIIFEAAGTSIQFHLQLSPDTFAAAWNAAQTVAGVQLALGANSPFFLGRELWRETRAILFEQATDTRSEELVAQGVRPRVFFGERWINSPVELIHENVRYFSALLPYCDDEDPVEVLERGEIPHLTELRLHNGTVWRWNRPVYDVQRGKPHLRIENRVLPAGPTVADMLANAALYYGLVRSLCDQERPIWRRMTFSAARENFYAGARYGIDAKQFWPGLGNVAVTDLMLRRLLPLAYDGLDLWKVEPADRDRLLGIIEQRCLRRTNGADWQAKAFHRFQDHHRYDRARALCEVTKLYVEWMRTGEPVHTWPLP
jgi:gamma-glutamyl:cysteine ligase YbdK (ATP-grasp superfamily)